MTPEDYQIAALRTWIPDERYDGIICDTAYLALSLSGEAGEFANKVKKIWRHGHDWNVQELAEKLGDILWYVAVLSEIIGYDLEEVMQTNIEKLERRYPNGFSAEDSRNRTE